MVDIVQLVERQIVDLVVVGSSPSIHPRDSFKFVSLKKKFETFFILPKINVSFVQK